MKPARQPKKSAALVGLAFDCEDGQKRLTRGKNFVLAGGSQESHSQMQETAIKVNEKLDQRGKQLHQVSPQELADIFHDVVER